MGNGILSIEECPSNIIFRRIHDSRLDPISGLTPSPVSDSRLDPGLWSVFLFPAIMASSPYVKNKGDNYPDTGDSRNYFTTELRCSTVTSFVTQELYLWFDGSFYALVFPSTLDF
jgi:hypothetical protein